MKFLPFLFSAVSFLFSCPVFSQLQVSPNSNADSLAGMLAGPNMIVSNAILNCPGNTSPVSNPSGTFDGTASNIGINSGVLLTTGDIANAVGPNVNTAITSATTFTFNDPDLMLIEPQAVNDVCILEFTAKPSCDSVYVKFVFGSDEYPEYAGSSYNDAFGIFVTGPNPIGPAYSGFNMTSIPNTSNPVSINNVNNGTVCPTTGPCMNCNYYIDNCGGATIEYDGFTAVITKTLQTVAYQPYQFKFAIADAGDHAFDSGVFFGLGSFSCLGGVVVPEALLADVTASVFPNPFCESAQVSVSGCGSAEQNLIFRLFDVYGDLVKVVNSDRGAAKFRIERVGLASGIYFYSVGSSEKIISRGKLVIE